MDTSPNLRMACQALNHGAQRTAAHSVWNALLADFKALKEAESIMQAHRDRWMQMAETCVREIACMQSRNEFPEAPMPPSQTPPHATTTKTKPLCSAGDSSVELPGLLTSERAMKRMPSELKIQKIRQLESFCSENSHGKRSSSISLEAGDSKAELVRKHLWHILENPGFRYWAEYVHRCYAVIIALSVVATIVSTLENSEEWLCVLLVNADYGFNTLFTLEVLVRLIAAPSFWLNAKSMYFWMDLAAVIPFYIRVVTRLSPTENAFIELVSLLIPIFRLLKITRHSNGWRLLLIAMRKCVSPLLVPLFFLTLLTVFFSCAIFWIEKHSACKPDPARGVADDPLCPQDAQMAFLSIPHAMWFALVTMSTVGYGDVYPNTKEAKIASSFMILVGVCYLSMPLTIVGSTFQTVWENKDVILIREKTKERFRGITKNDVQRVFELADESGSGTLTREEFIELVKVLDVGMSVSDAITMFKSIEKNLSGEIVFDEFLTFLFPEIAAQVEENELLMRRTESTLS